VDKKKKEGWRPGSFYSQKKGEKKEGGRKQKALCE